MKERTRKGTRLVDCNSHLGPPDFPPSAPWISTRVLLRVGSAGSLILSTFLSSSPSPTTTPSSTTRTMFRGPRDTSGPMDVDDSHPLGRIAEYAIDTEEPARKRASKHNPRFHPPQPHHNRCLQLTMLPPSYRPPHRPLQPVAVQSLRLGPELPFWAQHPLPLPRSAVAPSTDVSPVRPEPVGQHRLWFRHQLERWRR